MELLAKIGELIMTASYRDRASELLIELGSLNAFIGYLDAISISMSDEAQPALIEVSLHGLNQQVPIGQLGEPRAAALGAYREIIISELADRGITDVGAL
jgi:hypothetical protein